TARLARDGDSSGPPPVDSLSDAAPTVANAAGMVPLNEAMVVQATHLLAIHVGPIARILTRRAARESAVVESFVERLTQYIDDHSERARFITDMGL
ncbi:MAG TPA: hypothetical protein VKB34_16965, partial [Povalibacter sp.]|nr:hypothetical protein [Povalibacter sp.]